MCLAYHLLVQKTGDEKRRHDAVAGIPPGNALCVLTPGRSNELVDFSADTLRDAEIWDGARLPWPVAEDSAANADWSVGGVCSPDELDNWPQLKQPTLTVARGPPSLNSKTTVQGVAGDQLGGDKRRRSRRTRLEENLMRGTGESTLVYTDDAGVWSLKEAVSEAEELTGNGDESGARHLVLAELAAIRSGSRRAELHPPLRRWRWCLR